MTLRLSLDRTHYFKLIRISEVTIRDCDKIYDINEGSSNLDTFSINI